MKKQKKGKKFTIYKLFGWILIISSLCLIGILLYINILPIKYLLILSGIIFLLDLICTFFLFRKKVKKKPRKTFSILSLILSLIFLGASFFIYKTFGVLDNMSKDTQEYTYYVMVLNNSNYDELEDLKEKSLMYYDNETDSIKKATTELETKIKTINKTDNLEQLGLSLLKGETDSILVEEQEKAILDAASGSSSSFLLLSNFDTKAKVIYTFKVKAKLETKEVNVTKDVFNIYISGMDSYGEVKAISRSDVNMIMTINTKTKQILMTNIPRDYYVQLAGTSGYKDKLTHAGNYGINTSVKTIENLLDIDINYYFKVNFSTLEDIVDALGGVEVYSEYSFQSFNGYNFTKGYNKVNGAQALAFVRERHSFSDGDNQRGKNQQAMIDAMFRKCTSPSIITKYNSLLNSLKDGIITNMPTKSMTKLAKMQLKDNAKWTITSNSIKGTGSSEYTYTYPYQLLSVVLQNKESINKAKEQINKVFNDEVLESSFNSESSNVHSVSKSYVAKKKKTTPKKKAPVKKEEPKVEITCEEGYIKDETGTCVEEPKEEQEPVTCDPGYHLENGECIIDEEQEPTPPVTEECEEGYIKDETGTCVLKENNEENYQN